MYERILVPLDGSRAAENVLPYAHYLARRLGAAVELLTSVDVPDLESQVSAERAAPLHKIIENGMRAAGEYLGRIGSTFTPEPTVLVREGRAEEVIIEEAAKQAGTLIAMATHGRSGLDRWVLGSVAEKVVRGAKKPVLLVRARKETNTKSEVRLDSVMVPLDGSELAESILPAVAVLAKKLCMEIVLLRTYRVPYGGDGGGDGYYAIDLNALIVAARDEAESYLEKKAEDLIRQGVTEVSCVVREGLSADQIISEARKVSDCLIAMCAHGRSGLGRWILGSITETVVRHAENPVLVMRPS
jgi:nucleotide-binding universal stress UspA family protein